MKSEATIGRKVCNVGGDRFISDYRITTLPINDYFTVYKSLIQDLTTVLHYLEHLITS